jgi:hypothetical protein
MHIWFWLFVACGASAFAQDGPAIERDAQGRVRVKLERGGKVTVDNRTTGRIVVHGWDKDYIEAVATSRRGTEYVAAVSEMTATGQSVFLKADFLPEERTPLIQQPEPLASPTPPASQGGGGAASAPESSGATERRKRAGNFRFPFDTLLKMQVDARASEAHLEVHLPRHAELEVINVNRSEVEVTDIETPVVVNGNRSFIRLRRVGAVEARNGSGDVEVEGASGLVDVTTESGHVSIRDARGDVRALSLSGDVTIRCARGRVNVNNARGSINISGAGGDADATTVNGDITFNGSLKADGRYHLKSMSGAVGMTLYGNPPGFTALLSSYRGQIEDGFSLKRLAKASGDSRDDKSGAPNPNGARLLGRHGNGQAQITLDSFDGTVKLNRVASGATPECKL